MSLGRFLKENHVLVVGILLPLLLVGVFALAKAFPFHVVPDPTFRAVYAINNYNYGYGQFTYKVTDDGKLDITFIHPKKDETQQNAAPLKAEKARLFIFTPSTGALEDTALNAPDLKGGEEKISVPLEKFASLKLSSQVTAPDGYRYENRGYGRSSLVTDILSYRNTYGPLHAVVKDNRVIPLPTPANIYGDVVFIGWIIEEQK